MDLPDNHLRKSCTWQSHSSKLVYGCLLHPAIHGPVASSCCSFMAALQDICWVWMMCDDSPHGQECSYNTTDHLQPSGSSSGNVLHQLTNLLHQLTNLHHQLTALLHQLTTCRQEEQQLNVPQ
jgi:hypothetical protein